MAIGYALSLNSGGRSQTPDGACRNQRGWIADVGKVDLRAGSAAAVAFWGGKEVFNCERKRTLRHPRRICITCSLSPVQALRACDRGVRRSQVDGKCTPA